MYCIYSKNWSHMVCFTLETLLRRLRKVWDLDMEILKHSLNQMVRLLQVKQD